MNKYAITFSRTCKFFSKIIRSGLGEILEMHSAVFNDIDSTPIGCTTLLTDQLNKSPYLILQN